MITIKQIAWLAGLIEGEGCFHYFNNSPKIIVVMSDEDVIKEVASLFKRQVNIRKPQQDGYKVQYTVMICGTPAIEWMFTLYPLLKSRRREKIKEIVSKWKDYTSKFKRDTFNCGCPRAPENTYYMGKVKVCKQCTLAYQKEWRARKNGNRRLS